jgi:flagellar hook-basal body complex protein FliE
MATSINLNSAASAYEAANRLKGLGGASPANEGGPSFLDLVSQGLDEAVGTQKQAEQLSKDAVMGKANINDVILAVQDADVVLSTLVSIRDRMVSAYQDILRMAI